MDYVFISYQTKDDSGNSKDVSDDEKAQLKSQAEAIASGLKEGGDLNGACRRARGNGSDTDV